MKSSVIKSFAKVNLSLNITGKTSHLHKIESMVAFISLHDEIFINPVNSKQHIISFKGKFSKNINKKNTVSKLFEILDNKNLLNNKKYKITINKKIPSKAGLGGGSMNAANIIKFFLKKKILKNNLREIKKISNLIGSDVILGLEPCYSIINSKNEIKRFKNYKKFYVLIVKPNFGCSTKDIYSKVTKFKKPKLINPNKKMFELEHLKNMTNCLESVAISKFSKLKEIKLFLENLSSPFFVRMTGSGSAFVAYFQSKKLCGIAKEKFVKRYKNYWCIVSKTI